MSFSINTNTAALNTLWNLENTGNMLDASTERLSTGLRINSAADDPSGLIISQQFQAQLSGISQALSNSQDAVNYSKTADGALGQISSLLQSARSLAVAASNSGVISSSQSEADNSQLQSIIQSINTISTNTQFGTKYLLNGSAGTSAAVTNGADVSSLTIGGTFGGVALNAGGAVNMTVTTAATQAVVTLTATFNTAGSAVPHAGQFTINGTTFTASASDTASTVINMINQSTGTTHVTAVYDATGKDIVLNSTGYGSGSSINVADANGVVLSAPGSASAAGVDAVATLKIGSTTVTFTGGLYGHDGLTLSDKDGNSVRLTIAGNATTVQNAVIGQVTVNSAQFQIGANAGQTASFSLGNFAASQLGTTAVSGFNMSNIDVLTGSDAQTALQVIDAAITQVAASRGQLGAFQSDILDPNVQVLGSDQQNLTASNSQIMDTNVAQEMTTFTQLQVLEQAGMSVLSQANTSSQSLLTLIRNG